jgi:hypothetical protein
MPIPPVALAPALRVVPSGLGPSISQSSLELEL